MLAAEPNDSFLKYALALELEKEGKDDDAILLIEQILLNDVNYFGAYYKLGQLHEKNNQKDKARLIYLAGIETTKKLGKDKVCRELKEALQNLED